MINNIINTNIDYTHDVLSRDIRKLKAKYSFIETGSIGKSVFDRELFFIKLGEGKKKVFLNGAHHSLEWITSVLLMKFVEDYCKSYESKQELKGYDIKNFYNNTSIYIVPMVNPDGIDLVLNGIEGVSKGAREDLIKWNNDSDDFSKMWQANARGVDLNHNYDASWNDYKTSQAKNNITGPANTRYSGPCPESEPETASVTKFTRDKDFDLVLALHSQGKEIYWNYSDIEPKFSREIGENLARVSGYDLKTPTLMASNTGFKDWFIKIFNRPGYTIEVGLGKNPLPIGDFSHIYKEVLPLLLEASRSVSTILK